MFVTSDIYDLAAVSRFRNQVRGEGWTWREQLVGGVALHGDSWPGEAAAGRFLQYAVDALDFGGDAAFANYRLLGQERFRSIKPASIPKIIDKHGASLRGLDCRGARPMEGACGGSIKISCSVSSPLDQGLLCVVVAPKLIGDFAASFLADAADLVGAEYGYAFVRDAIAGPENYALGMGVPLDYSELEDAELRESGAWMKVVLSSEWRAEKFPLRDIFEVNLLTDWQLGRSLRSGSTLRSWIDQSASRGRLEAAGDKQFLWRLDEAEMASVRDELLRMAVVVSSLPRIYRGLGETPGLKLFTTISSAHH